MADYSTMTADAIDAAMDRVGLLKRLKADANLYNTIRAGNVAEVVGTLMAGASAESCRKKRKALRRALDEESAGFEQARLKAGLTLKQLHERSGVAIDKLSLIERGARNPRLDVAMRIAAALGGDLDTILTGRAGRPLPAPLAAVVTADPEHPLRALRAARGLDGKTLAKRAGLSPQAYSAIEAGRRKPSLDSARRLAEALGVSLTAMASAIGRKADS